MYYLYKIVNNISGTIYYGITNNIASRMATHKHNALKSKRFLKYPLYCAIRSYGWDAFSVHCVGTFDDLSSVQQAEVAIIAKCKEDGVKMYNLHPGGTGGFSILTKSPEEIVSWKEKRKATMAGRDFKPALGMKHTDENKKLFSAFGKLRWDIYGRYPAEEVLLLSFIDANKKYGISKTHYYRLKKQLASNESK